MLKEYVLDKDGKLVSQEEIVTPTAAPSLPAFIPRIATPPQLAGRSGADAFDAMRQRLANLDGLLQKYNAAAQARGGEERLLSTRAVMAKVTQLRDALLATLDNPSVTPDAVDRLTPLKHRLHLQTLEDQGRHAPSDNERETDKPAPTPTLNGFTHHR